MKALTLIALSLTPYLSAPAFADGGSIGGGTNISVTEGKLTDLVKFEQDYGKDAKVIDPRAVKFRKSSERLYDSIKPIIDHAENLYPGFGRIMENALDKPWVLVGKTFPARKPDEKKVVVQNRDAIYLDRDWVKEASKEEIIASAVHEMVRHLAQELLLAKMKKEQRENSLTNDPDYLKREDELTELLTPAILKKLPQGVFNDLVRRAGKLISENYNKQRSWGDQFSTNPQVMTREDLYAIVRKNELESKLAIACQMPESQKKIDWSTAMERRLAVQKSVEPKEFRLDINKFTMDPEAAALFDFTYNVAQFGDTNRVMNDCAAVNKNRFLAEYRRDNGTVNKMNPGSDSFDDEDEAPAGAAGRDAN